MKSFQQFLNESKYEKMDSKKLFHWLEKTEKTIQTFKSKNPGYSFQSSRVQNLSDRYSEIADILRTKYKDEWHAWNKKNNTDPRHDGGDMFA